MIFLIRHATPKIDYTSCDYKTAQLRLQDYNQTKDIEESEIAKFLLTELFQKIKESNPVVYCSPVARAERTCQLLFGYIDDYIINSDLSEVGLNIFPLPLVKLKVRTWFLLSRIAWLLRLSSEPEKVKHAKCRAQRLLPQLEQEGNVAIVSHGYLMHYLKKRLVKNQFQSRAAFKHGCFTVEVWDK